MVSNATLLTQYSFDTGPVGETYVDLFGIDGFDFRKLVSISNTTKNVVLFDRGRIAARQFSGTRIYLSVDTSSHGADDELEIVYQSVESMGAPFLYDAGGRMRVTSNPVTIFDGKTVGQDDLSIWHTAGTGTLNWENNKSLMSVTSGQYYLRQSNISIPYFSGKSSIQEFTMENFQLQNGVEKGFGYLSSSTVAPYTASYDGWCVVNTGASYEFRVYNSGTLVHSSDWTAWDNYAAIASYNFNKFTVFACDWLWLGGTRINLYMKLPNSDFELVHTYHHAGNESGTMFLTPNQPLRYWIRSTTGNGSYTAICSMAGTEGEAADANTNGIVVLNTSAIATNNVGTIYALKGVKKHASFLNTPFRISSFSVATQGTSDAGYLLLLKNPTLSAPLSYTQNGWCNEGTATTQTVSTVGTVLAAEPIGQFGGGGLLSDFGTYLQSKVDGTVSEYVLAYAPTTSNQSVYGIMKLKRY